MKIIFLSVSLLFFTYCRFVDAKIYEPFLVSSSKYRRQNQLLPQLQAQHRQNIHHLVRELRRQRLPPPPQRFLQTINTAPTTAPAPPPTLCNATTGLVNFDDDSYQFGTGSNIYDSTCFCEEGRPNAKVVWIFFDFTISFANQIVVLCVTCFYFENTYSE